jgi:hypothetical protein
MSQYAFLMLWSASNHPSMFDLKLTQIALLHKMVHGKKTLTSVLTERISD